MSCDELASVVVGGPTRAPHTASTREREPHSSPPTGLADRSTATRRPFAAPSARTPEPSPSSVTQPSQTRSTHDSHRSCAMSASARARSRSSRRASTTIGRMRAAPSTLVIVGSADSRRYAGGGTRTVRGAKGRARGAGPTSAHCPRPPCLPLSVREVIILRLLHTRPQPDEAVPSDLPRPGR